MPTPHPPLRRRARPFGSPGRIVAALAVVPLIASVSMVSASALALAPDPAPLIGTSAAGAIAGQYVVVLKDPGGLSAAGVKSSSPGKLVADAARRGKRFGATVQDQYTQALQGYAADLDPTALARVRADPAVAYVQANQRYHSTDTQDDADWGLDRIDQRSLPLTGQYYSTGTGAGVTAYVVDTGIRATHFDFSTDGTGNAVASRVTAGVDEMDDGGLASCDPNDDTQFDAGHGTHVAGTLGGVLFGVAKDVTLVPVRVLGCDGGSTSKTVAKGLDWIVATHTNGPAVANLSLSNEGDGPDTVVEAAVKRVIADNVSVVIAAGNGDRTGKGVSACSFSPGDVGTAITVGSTTKTDQRSSFSNFGSCVDLYAPGSDIVSDWSTGDDEIATLSGTSMATPHVAGAVALYLENHPTATPAAVQSAIVRAATGNKVTNVSTNWPRKLLFALQPVTEPPPPTTAASAITSGTALLPDAEVCSPNRLYCLQQQSAGGNLVLVKPGNRMLWRNTGRASAWTKMDVSGDLTSYDIYNRVTWSSKTSGGPSTLNVQNNGKLTITADADQALKWTSNPTQKTAPPQITRATSTLLTGSALYRGGAKLVSPNGRFSLALRINGDLVLAETGVGTRWHTGAKDDDWLNITSTGNLVLYRSDGIAVWKTATAGQGPAKLVLSNTGTLTLSRISDQHPLWSTP